MLKRKGTKLKTHWIRCSGFDGRVRLIGRLGLGCEAFNGRLEQQGAHLGVQVIRAVPSQCGDHVVDPGSEQCDGTPGCDSSCRGSFGGTGAFGVVTSDGLQKMYLPLQERNAAGNGVVAVVDVGISGSGTAGIPALITHIDLGTPDRASATGGNTDVVVATSTESRTVWFIDPRTDTVTGTLILDDSFGRSCFSEDSADCARGDFVTGVAVDSVANRAILSVWNGFALVDLASRTLVRSIVAAPSENFGFDAAARRIIAPFYNCGESKDAQGNPLGICGRYVTPDGLKITEGLNIIDLSTEAVYTFQDQQAANPTTPLGHEPDSAAADAALSVIVVAPEDGDVSVVDLRQARFDPTTGTVTAPRKSARVTGIPPRLTGVAIEQTSHYAFLEEEGNREQDAGNGVGVLKLDDFLADRASLVVATMPPLPSGQLWRNMGDPHGIAVTTGLDGNRPLGFLVERNLRWVARVDLETFAASGQIQPALTYLDANLKGTTTAPVVLCSTAP